MGSPYFMLKYDREGFFTAIKDNLRYKVGGGRSILFWRDCWLSNKLLMEGFTCPYKLSTNPCGKIMEMGEWREGLLSVVQLNKANKWVWSNILDENYTVKSDQDARMADIQKQIESLEDLSEARELLFERRGCTR
ncbi:hypothetical protein H0E87_028105 [Populus deltoides]|uniref:Uncharacterized protein n=1 Tax=Populus deltoides TaxID=3696 RepID=A0A8T2WQH5_POPDE|nr:hypothetical protein H0E87_028105 [Populus deltoides]